MRHPSWLKVKIPSGENYIKIKKLIHNSKTHSICEEAKCPNIEECWLSGTATFLILGNRCTRNCLYCNVTHKKPDSLDKNEPKKIANIIKKLNLKYAVITSVTRDDIQDYGASIFFNVIKEIKKQNPKTKIEILTPDFNGDIDLIKRVLEAKPNVFGHNIEITKSHFKKLRPQGNYDLSINFLKAVKSLIKKNNLKTKTKSGLMIGFGETEKEIINTLKDLKKAEVDIITIGQYLQPSKKHYRIKKYYTPEEFKDFERIAKNMKFKYVFSGPLVRSSYHAGEIIK